MNESEARQALRDLAIEPRDVVRIEGGWAYWTFEVDREWIARFPRDAKTARACDRELRLLPALDLEVSFQVPLPSHRGRFRGAPFFVYRRIPGRALASTDRSPEVIRRISDMLGELHAFPAGRAAELLGAEATAGGWRRYYQTLWPAVRDEALPALDRALAHEVSLAYRDFLARELAFPIGVVHFDLGPDHLLVEERTGLPTGIIDFESAWVGDPVVDYLWLGRVVAGADWRRLAGGRDLGVDVDRRAWFYSRSQGRLIEHSGCLRVHPCRVGADVPAIGPRRPVGACGLEFVVPPVAVRIVHEAHVGGGAADELAGIVAGDF